MFEKQKDKPDPDVLLEMASYYVVSVEAMNKRVMDVRPENIMLLCSVSQRGRRKKGIGGGGGEQKEEDDLPNPPPFSHLPQGSKTAYIPACPLGKQLSHLLARDYFLLVFI